jgi:hypothetical protein
VRGGDNLTSELFSYVDLEAGVRRDHPLRAIRVMVNEALAALEREFAALYSPLCDCRSSWRCQHDPPSHGHAKLLDGSIQITSPITTAIKPSRGSSRNCILICIFETPDRGGPACSLR